ncbi:MAG: HAD-IC family P-type ATPase [Patescibacteria group bacterium]|nr:HAD-IC family P-type ATPase [Patescibacteria group bacterium]
MKLTGLTYKEVLEKRLEFGQNILPEKEKAAKLTILLQQFKSPLIYILIFVLLVSLFFREFFDATLISSVIFLNICMGYFQEYSAQKTLSALKNIIRPKALSIREGVRKLIGVENIVPDDIIVLGIGDRIPADGILIVGTNLLVKEAMLTGEEEAISKKIDDRLFMGTTVISGKGIMKVTKTGLGTEIGKIGKSLSEIKDEKTPLQLSLEKFARSLSVIVIVICMLIFIAGFFHGEEVLKMLRISVILSIAAIPEGLPIAVTIILSIGIKRILKRKGLVKQLLSVETLGATSVICLDKTGTLTQGIMQVVKGEFSDPNKALMGILLNNEQKTNLELALWEYASKNGNHKSRQLINGNEKIYDEPFDSSRKHTFSINKINNKEVAFIVGAPEILVGFCSLNKTEEVKILRKIEEWADEGLRILGVASKEEGNLKEKRDFTWLGLVGVKDPLREEAQGVIKKAQGAGIEVKIITGDYRKTAEKVAYNLGFSLDKKDVLEGKDLEKLSGKELLSMIDNIVLFTRVTPHHKLRIVQALQKIGKVVAMTGDGVNDAQALKKADIGVVMGDSTDVAKEAGDLILLDNNFKTIVAAVEEGRLIFENIKKVIGYVLSNSFAEMILIFGSMLLDLPIPLTIVQILWIHLICDGPPDIVLGFESSQRDLLKEKPRNIIRDKILDSSVKFLIFSVSLLVGVAGLLIFRITYINTNDLDLARTLAFSTLGVVSLIYIFAFKDLKLSLFRTRNLFRNKYLNLAVIYGFILILLAVYTSPLNSILGTKPLELKYWGFILGTGIIATLIVETIKHFRVGNSKK